MRMFDETQHWLIFNNNTNLENFPFGMDSRVFLLQVHENEFKIEAIYKYSVKFNYLVANNVAKWTPQDGFLYFNKITSSNNRTNLMGTQLNISYAFTDPRALKDPYDNRGKNFDLNNRVGYVLVDHLITYMNATPKKRYNTLHGYLNETTGLFSGLMGDIQQDFADLAGTPAYFKLERLQFVDYLAIPAYTYMNFIFRAPPLSYLTNVYSLPFNKYVWYVCFLMVLVCTLVLFLIIKWEWINQETRSMAQEQATPLRSGFIDVCMAQVGGITQQGFEGEPQSYSGRIATFIILIILNCLFNAYSANIVALLQSTSNNLQDLEDLLHSRIQLGAENKFYQKYFMEKSDGQIQQAICREKVKENYLPLEEGIRKVRYEFFGFNVENSIAYSVIEKTFYEHEKCSLREIPFEFMNQPMLSCNKNSTNKEIYKIGLRKLHESGIQMREWHRYFTRKPICSTSGTNFDSVGLIDLYSGFLIFGIGVGISLLLFIFELIFKLYLVRKN